MTKYTTINNTGKKSEKRFDCSSSSSSLNSNPPSNFKSNLEFNKTQLQIILDSFSEKNSIHDLMQITLNSLLKTERKVFLENEKEDGRLNKGNGYRYRQFLGDGKLLSLNIPRDRLGVFKPVITAILNEREELARELCFDLYAKGLTTGDISEVVSKIYGREYDESRISQFNVLFWEEMKLWRNRGLDNYYPVIYLDCLFQKVKRGNVYESEAFYVVLGLKEDYTREVVGIYNNPTESSSFWKEILEDLKLRGVEEINLIVADGINNLENEVGKVYPKVKLQKCVTHLKRNILLRTKTKDKYEMAEDLRYIFNLEKDNDTLEEAKERINQVIQKWRQYPHLRTILTAMTIDYYFTYLHYNKNIRNMIYTTNWIERLNKTFRKTLYVRNTMPNVESCLALLSKVAINANNRTYSYKIFRFNLANFKKSNSNENIVLDTLS
jgi:transposase-like protein